MQRGPETPRRPWPPRLGPSPVRAEKGLGRGEKPSSSSTPEVGSVAAALVTLGRRVRREAHPTQSSSTDGSTWRRCPGTARAPGSTTSSGSRLALGTWQRLASWAAASPCPCLWGHRLGHHLVPYPGPQLPAHALPRGQRAGPPLATSQIPPRVTSRQGRWPVGAVAPWLWCAPQGGCVSFLGSSNK